MDGRAEPLLNKDEEAFLRDLNGFAAAVSPASVAIALVAENQVLKKIIEVQGKKSDQHDKNIIAEFQVSLKYKLIGAFHTYQSIADGTMERTKSKVHELFSAGISAAGAQITDTPMRTVVTVFAPILFDRLKKTWDIKKAEKIVLFRNKFPRVVDLDNFLNEITLQIANAYRQQITELNDSGVEELTSIFADIIIDYISEKYGNNIVRLRGERDPIQLTVHQLVYFSIVDWNPRVWWKSSSLETPIGTIDNKKTWYAIGLITQSNVHDKDGECFKTGAEGVKYGARLLLPGEFEYKGYVVSQREMQIHQGGGGGAGGPELAPQVAVRVQQVDNREQPIPAREALVAQANNPHRLHSAQVQPVRPAEMPPPKQEKSGCLPCVIL